MSKYTCYVITFAYSHLDNWISGQQYQTKLGEFSKYPMLHFRILINE